MSRIDFTHVCSSCRHLCPLGELSLYYSKPYAGHCDKTHDLVFANGMCDDWKGKEEE